MSQTALIIAKKKDIYFEEVESAILKRGLQTLTLRNVNSLFERLHVEPFVAIVVDASLIEAEAKDFINKLYAHPIGAITPLVIIDTDQNKTPRDFFGNRKTLLDQSFSRSGITTDALAEYLTETVKESHREAKKGNLAPVGVPAILQIAHNLGLTGVLILEHQDDRKVMYFQDGAIVSASSSNPHDFFGEFLCNKGFISQTQLKEGLAYAKAKDLRIGNALVQLQMIKPDILFPLLQEQLKNIIYQPFAWEQGSYSILKDELPKSEENIFKFTASSCIYEGVKRAYSEARLKKHFSNLNQQLIPNPNFADHLSDLPLENKERDVIKLLNSPKPISEVLQLSTLSQKETLQLLFVLQTLNICRLQTQSNQTDLFIKTNETPTPVPPAIQSQPLKEVAPIGVSKSSPAGVPVIASKPVVNKKTANKHSLDHDPKLDDTVPELNIPNVRPSLFSYKSFAAGLVTGVVLLVGVGLGFYKSPWGWLMIAQRPTPTVNETVKTVALEIPAAPIETAVVAPKTVEPKTLAVSPVAPTPAKETTKPVVVKKAAAVKPNNAGNNPDFEQHFKIGKDEYKKGNLEKAREALSKAQQLKPTDINVLLTLANVSYDMDNEEEALWYLRRVLNLDAQNAEAHRVLGGIYLMQNNSAEAAKQFKMFLRFSKDTQQKAEVQKILAQIK